MYPRTTTATLIAGILLVAPSCATRAPIRLAAIPEFVFAATHPDSNSPPAAVDLGAPDFTLGAFEGAADDDSPQRHDRRIAPQHRGSRFSAFGMVSFASGDYEFRDDVLGKDESNANMFRMRGAVANKAGIGGGFDLKIIVPKRDFYERTVNVTDLNHIDLFGFVHWHPTSGTFQLPIRVGPYVSNLAAEFKVTGDDTDYTSVGIRVEVAPEIVVINDGDLETSLFSRFSAGIHATTIDDESSRQEYDSEGYTLGLEAGVRLVFDTVSLSASYIFHETTIRESDEDRRGFFIPRLETEFTGVQVSLGVKF